MKLRYLLVLLLVVAAFFTYRSRAATARIAANEALYVPVLITPPVQPVAGQSVLFKASNISEATAAFRLMIYSDTSGLPAHTEDFTKVEQGSTVSYLYVPPPGKLTIGDTTVDVPSALRATFAPIPAGDPNVIRRIVASVQLMRMQAGASGPVLDSPILVPLERCRFEPRNFVPYTGGRWVWNCAPELSPIPYTAPTPSARPTR